MVMVTVRFPTRKDLTRAAASALIAFLLSSFNREGREGS